MTMFHSNSVDYYWNNKISSSAKNGEYEKEMVSKRVKEGRNHDYIKLKIATCIISECTHSAATSAFSWYI